MSDIVTAFINHTDNGDFHSSVSKYLYHNDLAAIHFNDTPISAHKDDVDKLDKIADYLREGAILGVRYHSASELQGGDECGTRRSRSEQRF